MLWSFRPRQLYGNIVQWAPLLVYIPFSGARVILACRDENKALLAVEDIRIATGNDNVVVGKLDLASLESIRTFAKHITETEDRLDILINNAGDCSNLSEIIEIKH